MGHGVARESGRYTPFNNRDKELARRRVEECFDYLASDGR